MDFEATVLTSFSPGQDVLMGPMKLFQHEAGEDQTE
jgi:hypothetical protein